jgi:alkylhydroperoxidase family enzyme
MASSSAAVSTTCCSSSSSCAPRRSTAAPIASTCTPRNCAGGESEQRLYLLNAWEESPFYSERERAALAWTEALTLITEGHVPDEVYEQARAQFSEEELANLTLAIVAINGANRLNIAFRTVPGSHRVARQQAAE